MDIMPDFDLIDREYAYDGELGALYSKSQTTFRVWSPTAQRAVLKLYLSSKAVHDESARHSTFARKFVSARRTVRKTSVLVVTVVVSGEGLCKR